MKTKLIPLVAFCLAASAAQANSIVGDWSGSGTVVTIGTGSNGAKQIADLVISSATPSGGLLDLLGTDDVTCIGFPASGCGTGGVVAFSGTLSSTGMLDLGSAANPNAFVGSYAGGNKITGIITSLNGDVYDWTFTRTSAVGVPEPATLGLLGLGLVAMGLRRRSQQR